MILVDYEEYTNDYCRSYKQKTLGDLTEFANWVFALCKGKYEDRISIPNPDTTIFTADEMPYSIDVNCIWEENKHYWIHQIKRDGKIIFTDGKYTNGIKHWSELMKSMCRNMLNRKANPQFDFEP